MFDAQSRLRLFDSLWLGYVFYVFCVFFNQKNPSDKSIEFGTEFKISHYAGDVKYSVNGFMEKNKDTLFQDFKRLLYNRYCRF